jgi:hypothetical protein
VSKEKVTAQQHLDLLNKVLLEQKGYRPGMSFEAAPPGAKGVGIWGMATATPYTDTDAYRQAERIVYELYEFDPSKE